MNHSIFFKIDSKGLLYSTGKSTQYSVMAYIGKNLKNWLYVSLIHFIVYLKLTQHGKSTVLKKSRGHGALLKPLCAPFLWG